MSTLTAGTPGETFGARLARVVEERGRLCVGIDPLAALLASWGLPDSAAGIREFGLRVVEASAGTAGIVKPQIGFFERHGSAGFAALEEVLAAARAAAASPAQPTRPRPRSTATTATAQPSARRPSTAATTRPVIAKAWPMTSSEPTTPAPSTTARGRRAGARSRRRRGSEGRTQRLPAGRSPASTASGMWWTEMRLRKTQ